MSLLIVKGMACALSFYAINILPIIFLSRSIYKWWAQYLESQSDMDSALHFYECAQDYLSLVRVYCYMGNIHRVT